MYIHACTSKLYFRLMANIVPEDTLFRLFMTMHCLVFMHCSITSWQGRVYYSSLVRLKIKETD